MKKLTERIVTADKVVTVTTTVEEEDRCIDYQDLLDCVKIEHDDLYEAWDGYDHDTRKVRYYDHDGITDSVAYIRYGDWSGEIIEFDSNVEKDFDDLYKYYRSRGQSKQVAFEAVAESRRLRMEQLVNWYENGWTYYYVKAEYNGYEAMGCGDIDDYDADSEYRMELADELADQLEADGFVIIGKPEPSATKKRNLRIKLDWNKRFAVINGRGGVNRSYRKNLQKRRARSLEKLLDNRDRKLFSKEQRDRGIV